MISSIEQLIDNFKTLEELYDQWIETRRQAYILQYQVRNALKSIKSPLPIPYPKYASKCRREARRCLAKRRGYEIDHAVSLKLLWAIGCSIEEANHPDNLCHLKKKANRMKSFKVDWEVFEKLYKGKML